jgi:glucosamine-6-phosphate deaminase
MTDSRSTDYLRHCTPALGAGQPVQVRVLRDRSALAQDMAQAMAESIRLKQKRGATLIVPVGPVDQYAVLADLLNEQRISCRDTVFINMDEYLTEQDWWVADDHPLSFRGFMRRCFYERLDRALAPAPENRIFPDPREPLAIQRVIRARGGVDVCFGGIGINGHIAFNEPPEPGESLSLEAFAALPTRTVTLARETRTINAVTVGGDIGSIPLRAITVGMQEILGSRQLRFYCNRPWQSAVVRRVLHGPITPACPASLLRLHRDAAIAMTEEVAAVPHIQLR